MHANEPYATASLIGFQLSLLRLDAALQRPMGSMETSERALVEVEHLKTLIEIGDR